MLKQRNNKSVYVHIGYPKTATTTLQNYLFPKHSQVQYLRDGTKNLSFIGNIFFARENSLKRNRNNIQNELKQFVSSDKNKYAYSEESLTSFSMFYRFVPNPYIWTVEPNSIARKLKSAFKDAEVFDDVKIIVTIRKQDAMIKSMYAQVYNFVFKKFKETKTFSKFLKYSIDENSDGFILDALHYNDVIKEYEDLFGKENICVLVFEELKQDKESYIKKLCEFMDIDFEEAMRLIGDNQTNKRSSSSGYKSDERNIIELLSFYKNKYIGGKSLGLSDSWVYKMLTKIYILGKVLKDLEINNEYNKKLNDFYAKGNKELSERYNLNLKQYGYYYE